jgi:hypothetical protein
METCTVEAGLLRKKPCGQTAVTKCATCEQPLCAQHAVPQLSAAGKRTGTFYCQECAAAAKAHDKSMAAMAKTEQAKKMAETAKAVMNPVGAPKKPAELPKAAPGKDAPPAADGGKPEDDAIEYKPEPKKPE